MSVGALTKSEVNPAIGSVRDRLFDAAEQCLAAKGIRATTVSELAGVSRGWLCRHFPDKAELLGAAIVRLNDAFWEESRTRPDSVGGLDHQIAVRVGLARTAPESPGALVLKLRREGAARGSAR